MKRSAGRAAKVVASAAPASARIAGVREALLSFYDAHRRDLPWRSGVSAYATWVSEIMLQQTRVETVSPYFHAFMRKFPTALALADATSDDVLAAWSGLGYYRRARMLHDGARVVVRDHGGELPRTRDALLALPGVGRYTAGAIASIAFGEEAPLVDGNVVRVLARVFGIDRELSPQDEQLWSLAQALVRGPRPGDLNQALMELGATACTRDAPSCETCGLSPTCDARRQGMQSVWPRLPAKKAAKRVAMEALVVEEDGKLLLCRRREEGLFGGLWEPPMVERPGAERRVATALFTELLGCPVEVDDGASVVRHVLTHRELTVTVRRGRLLHRASAVGAAGLRVEAALDCAGPYERAQFASRDALAGLGVSRLSRKLLETADAGNQGVLPRGSSARTTPELAEKKPRRGKLR